MAVTHSLSLVSASSQYAISSDADNLSVSNTGKISIGLWVNPTTLNNNNYAIWKGTSSNYEYQIVAGDANGAINVAFFSLAGNVRYNIVTVNNTIPINLWSNVFITLDDSVAHSINNLKIYVNGEPAVTGSSSSNSANLLGNGSAPLNVGRRQDTTVYFNGKISNIQVYNTVLSQSDIRSVMNYFVTSHANIVACWTLNNVYTDLIGSNTLTASGSPVFSTTYPDAIDLVENKTFTKKHKITVQHTQVAGSANLTDVPIVFTESNFLSEIFTNSQGSEINTNKLKTDSNLKAYYRFESGALTTDSSSNGYTLTNNNTVAEGTGKFGGGADLGNGNTNKYLSLASDLGIGGNADISISIWFKMYVTAGTHVLIQHASTTGASRYFQIFQSGGALYFDSAGGGGGTTPTITAGVWYHAVFTRTSAGACTSYLNAVYAGAQITGSGNNGVRLNIGVDTANYSSAVIDDVAIFNRVLSAEEVYSLYAGGQDLRFSSDIDGKTRLAHEIVSFDKGTSKAEVWVKANTLDFDDNTDIYVHYGNATASALDENEAFGKHQVYPSAYQAVWHYSAITDSTKNSYDGTNTNVTFSTTNGKIKEGANFNGSNTDINHSAKITPQGAKTVMYWFRKASNPASTKWIMANLANSTTQYGIDVAFTATGTNAFSLGRASATTNFTLTSSVLTDNTWNLIAVTWDGTTGTNGAKMYLNGTVNAQTTAAVTESNAPTNNLRIGCLTDGAGRFTGQLDNVLILNKVLTADEIQTFYNNQNNPATFAIPQSTAGGAFLLQFV
jgi:hypothetical protein